MELIGYLAAILIGISLGLIGGGGSILTVPVLVYLFGVDPVIATAYSLFIVGVTSLVGSYGYYKKGLISLKTALIFGIPSLGGVYVTRKWVVPAIPEKLFSLAEFTLTKPLLLMLLFAVLMVFASLSMIRTKKKSLTSNDHQAQVFNYPLIILEGLLVGFLTGLVGAGGGFLIIPALVLMSKLDMKMAVGTSLLIIAAKSLIGFLGDLSNYSMDWLLLGSTSVLAVAGIFIGSMLAGRIPSEKLKIGFGYFVLVMGVYILWNELF